MVNANNNATTLTNLPTELKAIIVKFRRDQAERDDISPDGWKQSLWDLSLVAKDFVALCQEELFRVVEMEAAGCRLGGNVPGAPNTLALFSRIVKSSPHLGRLVKDLLISFPKRSNVIIPPELAADISNTLKLLTNVDTLFLNQGPLEDGDPFPCAISLADFRDHPHLHGIADGIGKMMNGEKLEFLELKGINVSPQDLMGCTRLETLHLSPSDCFDITTLDSKAAWSEVPIYLKAIEIGRGLGCDSYFAVDSIKRHPRLNLSRVKTVVAPFQGLVLKDLLKCTPWPSSLVIKHSAYDPESGNDKGFLQWLHPNSFSTLRTLKLSTAFKTAVDWIRDPFSGLASDRRLLQLTTLRKLEIKVVIKSDVDLSFPWRASFGHQWSALDCAIVSSEGEVALSTLREVSIIVVIEGSDYNVGRAKKLLAYCRSRVFKRRFPRLMERVAMNEIDFRYRGCCSDPTVARAVELLYAEDEVPRADASANT